MALYLNAKFSVTFFLYSSRIHFVEIDIIADFDWYYGSSDFLLFSIIWQQKNVLLYYIWDKHEIYLLFVITILNVRGQGRGEEAFQQIPKKGQSSNTVTSN